MNTLDIEIGDESECVYEGSFLNQDVITL